MDFYREWADVCTEEEIIEEERIAGEEEARAAIADEFDARYAATVPPIEVEWTEQAFARHTVA